MIRIGPSPATAYQAWSVQLAQVACRVASHQSTPTDRPVEPLPTVTPGAAVRSPSRHAFDIRV